MSFSSISLLVLVDFYLNNIEAFCSLFWLATADFEFIFVVFFGDSSKSTHIQNPLDEILASQIWEPLTNQGLGVTVIVKKKMKKAQNA